MAFENLTLFELHLEDARIGPSFGDDVATEEPAETEGTGGGGRGLELALAGLLLVAAAAAAARMRRSGGAAEGGQITIEQAAEQ